MLIAYFILLMSASWELSAIAIPLTSCDFTSLGNTHSVQVEVEWVSVATLSQWVFAVACGCCGLLPGYPYGPASYRDEMVIILACPKLPLLFLYKWYEMKGNQLKPFTYSFNETS